MSPLLGSQTWKPTGRTVELLVEELGDELMVYDQRNDKVHCLGSAVGRVWRACDGQTSVEQLGSALSLDPGVVGQALGELEACELLDGEGADGVTRREVAARFAKIGAAAAAAPMIYSIGAPTPALAASQNFCENLTPNTGCAGNCTKSAPATGQIGCSGDANKNVFCNATCGIDGCACCFSSPGMCGPTNSGGSYHFVRCTASCVSANNICNVQYIANGGAPCNNIHGTFLPPANAGTTICNGYNACL